MTSRTGKPCSRGSGSPFMATATSATRPSKAYSEGKPEFQLSTERPTICVAPFCTPRPVQHVRQWHAAPHGVIH